MTHLGSELKDKRIYYDNRIKKIKDTNFIIINNYKCGYSASNILPYDRVESINSNNIVIFFYRDIELKTISLFINWIIDGNRLTEESGWLVCNIKRSFSKEIYNKFCNLYDTDIKECFKMFILEILQNIYHMNNHSIEQSNIIEYYNIKKIHYNINLDKDISKFKHITGLDFPHKNNGDSIIKNSLYKYLQKNDELKNKLKSIYHYDERFLI